MTQKIFIDRSRYETAQSCLRKRYYEYHHGGMGVVSARKPLPLAVGGSVHVGLAELLRKGQYYADICRDKTIPLDRASGWLSIEQEGVAAALADFSQHENAIDVDTGEVASRATLPADAPALSEMDAYLYREQSALVEGMVRAYARRRLRPLVEQFEVLEVEREGEWQLCAPTSNDPHEDQMWGRPDIWFMSRPDALLRERESNQLYLLSFKTTGKWDLRKARDAEHDMQGLSEGIEIERRLGEWWAVAHNSHSSRSASEAWAEVMNEKQDCPRRMFEYLSEIPAPPRILAVRYEYLLKGERWKDKDLSARFGVEMRSQKSHLIHQYVAVSVPQKGTAGYSLGDLCWSWDFIRDDGKESNLAWQNWKPRAVWEQGSVRDWIDALDEAAPIMSGEDSTMGLEPRQLGFHTPAQAMGVTKEHPLDSVFVPPITVFRGDDDLRDLIEQMEASERKIAEGVAQVEAATDDGERRHLLNIHFPQTRRACEFPATCSFISICYGGDNIRKNPLDSGKYKVRIPNHPQEGYNSDGETKP